MAEFIDTGVVVAGHRLHFEYPDAVCFVACECGWREQITSHPKPWAYVEMNSKVRRHLREWGALQDLEDQLEG